MRTNIEIDDTLMAEAQVALGCRTKKDTVDAALRLALRMRLREEALELVDSDTFWPGYDPEDGGDEHEHWDRPDAPIPD